MNGDDKNDRCVPLYLWFRTDKEPTRLTNHAGRPTVIHGLALLSHRRSNLSDNLARVNFRLINHDSLRPGPCYALVGSMGLLPLLTT